MNTTKKNIYAPIFILLVIIIVGGAFLFFPSLKGVVRTWYEDISDRVQSFTEEQQDVVSIIRQELFSAPLRSSEEAANPELHTAEVIRLTNIERTSRSGHDLTENAELTLAAERKLKDMFDKQYFEHISPTGHGPGYLADQAGYNYIVVGENLALGNFKDDAALVAAWMASPGHKENILNTRFEEIGVAVGKGMYQGRTVWLAVQEFGKPASDCPQTDPVLRESIEKLKTRADTLNTDLTARKAELETMPHNTQQENEAYNTKVSEYNAKVVEYEAVTKDLRAKITTYNAQVRAFNSCLSA